MPTLRTFEQIEAWQSARDLARAVYSCSKQGPLARDFGLRDQLRRASISIMSNIAEGFERGRMKEFVHFLTLAKGSAGELESHLYVALDQGYLSKEDFEGLRHQSASTRRLIAGFIRYLMKAEAKAGPSPNGGKAAMRQAATPGSRGTRKPDNQETGKPENQETNQP